MIPDSPPKRSSYRVLVVDDNPAIHSDFRKILGGQEDSSRLDEAEAALFGDPVSTMPSTRFLIDSAYQGQEGLEKVEQALREGNPYSLAFIDVRMPPGWDGVETIARIWAVDPTLQVVICTAYSDYSWDDMRARLGESDSAVILKKPFDNIEAIQLAHALTKKWLLAGETSRRLHPIPAPQEDDPFAALFRACPVALVIQSDVDERITEVNESFIRLTGYTATDAVGRTPAELKLWDTPVGDRRGLDGRVGLNGTCPLRTKLGQELAVAFCAERSRRNGQPVKFVFIQETAGVTMRPGAYAA